MPAALSRAADRLAPDGELLRRFAAARDGPAFAELVRRHGPLVLGVCRRTVPDRDAADDAFQAAFLVLAQRAAAVDPSRPLAAFLYGVAVRVSLRARTMIGRRRRRETLTAVPPEVPSAEAAECDTTAAVHEEVMRLPAAAREAVLLCELHGLSRKEAADKLGVPEGTLSSRLAAARKTLAARLKARGLAPVVSVVAVPVPAALAESASNIGAGGAVPPAVETLSRGVLAMAVLTKLKLAATFGLLLAFAAAWPGAAADRPERVQARRAAPVRAGDPSRIIVWTEGKVALLRADGTEVKAWERADIPAAHSIALSPDRTRVAVTKLHRDEQRNADGETKITVGIGEIAVYDLDELKPTAVELPGATRVISHWSADGRTLYAAAVAGGAGGPAVTVYAVDPRTGAAKPADKPAAAPAGFTVLPHGPFAAGRFAQGPYSADTKTFPTYLLPAAGDPVRLTGNQEFSDMPQPSPDGKRLLFNVTRCLAVDPNTRGITLDPNDNQPRTYLYEIATGKRTPAPGADDGDETYQYVWSPDGKRLLHVAHKPLAEAFEVRVVGADGKEPKTLREVKDAGVKFDWR